MTPVEIVAKFAHALDNLDPITGKPSDIDLTRIRGAVAPLLMQILYDKTGAVNTLISLIRPKAAYVARYDEAFPDPKKVGAYDPNIDDEATNVVRARLNATHKAKRAYSATFETA